MKTNKFWNLTDRLMARRHWLIHKLSNRSVPHASPIVVRIRRKGGGLAIARHVETVLMRHPLLDAAIDSDGELIQRTGGMPPFASLKLGARSPSEVDAEVERFFSAPFPIADGPLWRATVIEGEKNEYTLAVLLHHSVFEPEFAGELIMNLRSALNEKSISEPIESHSGLPAQALGHTECENRKLSAFQYWEAHLEGYLDSIVLPVQLGVSQESIADNQSYQELHENELKSLSAIATRHGTSKTDVLYAAFVLLLHRYSEQTDLTIATRMRNNEVCDRGSREFLTLPVRTKIETSINGQEAIRSILSTLQESRGYASVPFEMLPRPKVNKGFSDRPPFGAMFMEFEYPETVDVGSLATTEIARFPIQMELCSLSLCVLRTKERRKFVFSVAEAHSAYFNSESVSRHFISLIDALAKTPHLPVASLPMMTPNESIAALDVGRGQQIAPLRWTRLEQAFEEQAKRSPGAIAITFETLDISYAQLDRTAAKVALLVHQFGARQRDHVAIAMSLGPMVPAVFLGILKAGCIAVPVDPNEPIARLHSICDNANVRLFLTDEQFVPLLSTVRASVAPSSTIKIDPGESAGNSLALPPLEMDDRDVAFIVHTSGSTGEPKGVILSHKSCLTRESWFIDRERESGGVRFLAHSNFSHFWPLFVGGRVVIASPGQHSNGKYLCELIKKESVSHIHVVPSHLKLLLFEGELENCRSIIRVYCTGETLDLEQRRRLTERLNAQLCVLYGQTEANYVTAWDCFAQHNDTTIAGTPIGQPIAGMCAHVLDADLNPLPAGVAGELWVGGRALSDGYLKSIESDSKRFLIAPLEFPCCARLFRTGDYCRYTNNGQLEFIGRRDNQVKIRGYRIELEEVAIALRKHPAVVDAIADARDLGRGYDQLIAYVVLDNEVDVVDPQVVRRFASRVLPHYMVPSIVEVISRIPVTAMNKVDRSALPTPSLKESFNFDGVDDLASEERMLVDIWRTDIALQPTSIDDDLFELGADSLALVEMVHAIRSRFRIEMPLGDIIENPTVRTLAAALRKLMN